MSPKADRHQPAGMVLKAEILRTARGYPRRFGELANKIMGLIKANSEQGVNLGSIRDTLLPKLMSDEIATRLLELSV